MPTLLKATQRKRETKPSVRSDETMADVLERLGGIEPNRVRLVPSAGTATYNDLLALENAGEKGYELFCGTLVRKPMGWLKSSLASFLAEKMNPMIRTGNLGVLTGEQGGFRLQLSLVRMPDLAFVSTGRMPGTKERQSPILGVCPELAIEILSTSNTVREMLRKRQEFFAAGVLQCWLADPRKRTVRVYSSPEEFVELTEKDTLTGGDILPGFKLPLKEWFGEMDRLMGAK